MIPSAFWVIRWAQEYGADRGPPPRLPSVTCRRYWVPDLKMAAESVQSNLQDELEKFKAVQKSEGEFTSSRGNSMLLRRAGIAFSFDMLNSLFGCLFTVFTARYNFISND